MKKSYITNAILFLFVLGLYWFLNQAPSSTIDYQRISMLDAKQVATILIQRENRDDIVLNKEGTIWQIKEPIQATANATRVKLILDILSAPSHSQLKLDSKLSLLPFDLAPAKISLHINEQQFEFGNIEPLSKYRYIRHNNTVHLMEDTVTPLLNSNAGSFIDNRLFSTDRHITKLSLPATIDNNVESQAVIMSLENSHWTSTNSTYTADSMTALISAWHHAYAMQVIPMKKEALASSVGEVITIEFSDQTSRQLHLRFDNRSMSLIDLNKKLKYQFPLSIKQQLFPTQDTPD